MRKISNCLYALIVLFTISSCCTGKQSFFCNAEFSTAGGINFSNISEEDEYDGYGGSNNSSRIGYQVGVNALMPINENFGVQPGLGIASKGTKRDFESEGGEFGEMPTSSEEVTSLTYLDIPILARYQFNNSGFNTFGGLQPSLLLNAKLKSNENNQMTQNSNVTDQFKTFDTAAVFGLGYGFGNGISLNARYDLGLSNISDNQNFGQSKLRNRSFRISLAYTFN